MSDFSWIGLAGGVLGALAAVYTAVRVPAVERIRSALRRAEVRSSKLYDERLVVLRETYSLMVDAEWSLGGSVTPFRHKDTEPVAGSDAKARDAVTRLHDYFEHNKIMIPETTANQASELIGNMKTILQQFALVQFDPMTEQTLQKWAELWDRVSDELPAVRHSFEREVRSLLGDPDENG